MTQGRNLSRGAAAFAQLAERVGYTDERTVTLGRADGIVVANREQRLVYWHDNRIEGTARLGTSSGITFAQAERYAGLQVRIARPPNRDDYHVVEIDTAGYYALAGLTPAERLVNQALLPSVGQIETLRLTPAQPASYEVQVRGIYLFYNARGTLQLFSASSVDLASVAAGLSTNEHCFVIIYLDETDGTIGYVASTPTTAALSLPSRAEFGFADFMATAVPGEKRPLGAVYCYQAQNAIEEADFYRAYAFPRFETRGLQHNLTATAAPTSSDDLADGYSIGSLWINVSADTVYLCVDNAAGAAVWRQLDAAGSGTVTSVGLDLPSDTFDITGSPVTGSGTLTGAFKTQLTRYALIAPAGGGTPTWRALEINDIPAGTWAVTRGGTGRSSLTANSLLAGNGTGMVNLIAPSTSGNLLTSNGTEWQSVAPSFAASVITSGTVALARGGTGADLSATGGANQFVKQTSVGGAFSVAAIVSADLTAALTTPPAIGGTTPSTATFTTLNLNTGFIFIRDGAQTSMQVDTYLSGSGGTVYALRHARGSVASPSSLLQFDEIGAFNFSGYAGSGFSGLGQVRLIAQAQENFSGSAGGAALIIQTTALGATSADTRTIINPVGVHQMIATDTVNNNITAPGVFSHRTSGTPAVGIGSGVLLQVQTSTTPDTDAALISALWTDVTHASRKARLTFTPIDAGGGREALRLEADGSAARVGFYGATAVVKPTVTGSRGGNAALASLLTALANLGILTDSSSA